MAEEVVIEEYKTEWLQEFEDEKTKISHRVEVTAENQTKKTYTVIVNRAAAEQSNDATLKKLTLSEGILTPSFDRDVINYYASVAKKVSSITVTALVYEVTSSLTVMSNGGLVSLSDGVYGPINLNVGNNQLTFEVTAENPR